MKKRIVVLLLAISMILLVSCNQTGVTESSSAESKSESDTSEQKTDPLRDANFAGRDFTVLQRTEHSYEFKKSDDVSELINDQVAERNRLVEERYGVNIKTMEINGDWESYQTYVQYVNDTILGGTTDYDLIAGYAVSMPTLVTKDVFLNWHDLSEYMNLEEDWWYQDFLDQMDINGRMYMISGDLALTVWESMYAMFFNKSIIESNPEIENLYEVVRRDDWTFDYFYETLKKVDTQASGVADDEKVYSYTTYTTTQIDLWQDAFNIPVTEKDSSGKPYYSIANNPKILTAVDKIYELFTNKFTYVSRESLADTITRFGNNKACFVPLYLSCGTMLKSTKVDYGILPMPKYDKTQESNNSTCCDFYSVFSVPNTRDSEKDREFIGTVTEALCYYSNKVVIPSYYETVLKLRNTFDSDSAEMIDKVRAGLLCNFGYLYSMTLGWPAHQLNELMNAGSKDWVSNWQANSPIYEENLVRETAYYHK